MHFSHEKHQYYFEKYLRNEMKGEELQSFERKLQDDESFRLGFEHYERNRKEIVAEELAEYDKPELLLEKPQRWGWVYASISLLCIVLIVDYYLSSNYAGNTTTHTQWEPLINQLNIFKPKVVKKDSGEPEKELPGKMKNLVIPENYPDDSTAIFNQVDDQLVQYMEGNRLAIQGDYFVSDSLYKVLEVKALEERLTILRSQTDSLLDDSSLNVLVLKSYFRNPSQIKRQLLVEFWGSPIHFRGYLFNGKKLLLYGLDPQTPVYLSFSEENNYYHLFVWNKEFQLFADNQFHKIVEGE